MLPSKYNEILGEFNDLLTSGEKVVFKTLSIYRTIELDKIKIKLPDAPQGVHNKSDILLLMLLYRMPPVNHVLFSREQGFIFAGFASCEAGARAVG